MSLNIRMVDVFGSAPISGNPLAVIAGGDDLEPGEMQRLTRWFNLSETAFLLPATHPDADYRLRIFTLDREIPFAGHPTLGSCHAWLESGGTPKKDGHIIQECGLGLIAIRRSADRLSFAAPPLLRSGPPSAQELLNAQQFLGLQPTDVLDAAWIDNGPGWLGLRLASAEKVLALTPARSWPSRIEIGVIGPHASGSDAAFEVRAFFSDHAGGVIEDPVTGSLNASMAQWMFATGIVREAYVAAQGTCIGSRGRIHVDRDQAGAIWIGGNTRTVVEGQLRDL